jgi:hypothetical protein
MTVQDIANSRLINQQIIKTSFTTPKEMVGWLGAMQAQDYAMSKWAVGVRLKSATDESVERAIDSGDILRTHILRPTWHLVSSDDIRWMLALTAKNIRTAAAFMYRQLELNDEVFTRSNKIIEKTLEGKQLTRLEIMSELEKHGIRTNDLRAAHLMLQAELDGVVCNGAKRGKQLTYALLDERVPGGKTLTKDEALAELAHRYFLSHGPATLQDFTLWSGLSATDARFGLETIKQKLLHEEIGEQKYWFSNSNLMLNQFPSKVYLLPAFDEFMVSYKDRIASIGSAYAANAITGNGIFRPIVVSNGKVSGTWKRTIQKDALIIDPLLFKPLGKLKQKSMQTSAKSYAKFLKLKACIQSENKVAT